MNPRTLLIKINSNCVLSIKFAIVPINATPPSQITNELIQQQLVPRINVIILLIKVFLECFTFLLFNCRYRNTCDVGGNFFRFFTIKTKIHFLCYLSDLWVSQHQL